MRFLRLIRIVVVISFVVGNVIANPVCKSAHLILKTKRGI
jgi:hypothetical protein